MSPLNDFDFIAAARDIRLLLMDCDGVLTDGRLYFSSRGEELKVFDVQDGQGIVEWISAGYHIGIISGRSSAIVETRAKELGIQIVKQGVKDKLETAREIWAETGFSRFETGFIGDDTPDIALMEESGLGVAVANAVEEVKSAANHVAGRTGGRGAVREIIGAIMSAKALQDS